jgi:hypothetical protein
MRAKNVAAASKSAAGTALDLRSSLDLGAHCELSAWSSLPALCVSTAGTVLPAPEMPTTMVGEPPPPSVNRRHTKLKLQVDTHGISSSNEHVLREVNRRANLC